MKTLLILSLALCLSMTGFADPTNELAMLSSVSLKDQKARITLLEGINRVKVYVKDENGRTLYCASQRVNKSLVMPISLESLPVGKYIIRIETKDSNIDYMVETTAKKAVQPAFKATVKAIDNRYVRVSLYEMQDIGTLKVKVYDTNHRLLYQEKVEGGPFARRYEFKNASTKGIYFTISDSKGNYEIYYM
jgi:hypothetical protein